MYCSSCVAISASHRRCCRWNSAVPYVAGRPTVRDPEGSHRLEPWDLVLFPTGPEGAHRVQNDTEEPARVLMYSTVTYPAATVYPDSDKIAVWTGNRDDDLITRRSSGVSYYEDEG